ncbi:hypothetical protein [Pseudomonas sp. NPDC099000]|uniref:hypothetical protein n=1 Tax=Pseudomonas sp. NPDC099000 TaxID=3364488 RepID=UPI00383BD4F0
MTALFFFTPEQLAELKKESPQQQVDLCAGIRSQGLFTEDGAFAIFPILILGWHVVDYPTASYGVNADETVGPGLGWWVLFPSYALMAAFDTLRLYMSTPLAPGQAADPADRGTLIKTETVPRNHNNEDIVSFIPRTAVEKPGIHRMWYTVERTSGNGPERSEEITVWFKPTFPDSRDPNGNTPERVPLEAPRFPAIIDKTMVEEGVDVTIPAWPIMTVGDVITLMFGNQIVEYTLKPEEVGQNIVVFVSAAVLKLIGPADPLLVSYKIRDQVHNSSLTSKTGEGKLDPNLTYLEAPSVVGSNGNVLKIDDLNGKPMEIEIFVERADAIPGDKVECFIYNPKTGLTQSFGPFNYQRGIVTVEVLYEIVKNLAPATIEIYYERIRVVAGVEKRTPSYSHFLELIGKKYRAPAPTAPQAHGAVLSPDLAETVVYAGPGIEGLAVGDKVTLTCLSTSAGGTTRLQTYERFVTQSMVIPGEGIVVPFVCETTHFETYQNGSVRLSYTVTGIGHAAPLESYTRRLRIGQVTNLLGVVDVGKDENGVLDPKVIPFGTSAICLAKGHTRIGDTVHLEVRGPDGNPVFADSLPITAAHLDKDIEFRLAYELINSLLNQVIKVDWYIERERELPLTAPELVLRIGAKALVLPPPELVQASPGTSINPQNTQKLATVKVTYTGMDPTHRVTLFVKGREGFGSPVLATLGGSASGTLIFTLPLTAVPANMGTFMSFWYVVTQEGIHDQSSAPTRYEVTSIPNEDINYPRMTIKEAPDHKVLNLNNFTGDAHWTLIAWLFIAIGTRMRVALSGQKADGSEHVIMLFEGVINANHVNTGLSGVISREQLQLFKDGTEVFGLSIANLSNKGGIDTFFPMRELTIKSEMLARPMITQLIDNQGAITGQVVNGGTCDDPTPELVGTATPKSVVHLFNGESSIETVTADINGIWRKVINIGLGRHSLTAKTPDGQQVSPPWAVTVQADLNSVTSFNNANFNGWAPGIGAQTGRFLGSAPNALFHIFTPGKINNSGLLFSRAFQLVTGARYEFSCQVYNTAVNGYDVDPKINLVVNNMLNTPVVNIYKHTGWITVIGSFTATSINAMFNITNYETGDIGNDFYINLLTVRQLSN